MTVFHGKAVSLCGRSPAYPSNLPARQSKCGPQCGLFVQQRQRLRFSRLIFREERGALTEDTQTSLAGLEAGRVTSWANKLAQTLLPSVAIRDGLAVATTPDQRGSRAVWSRPIYNININSFFVRLTKNSARTKKGGLDVEWAVTAMGIQREYYTNIHQPKDHLLNVKLQQNEQCQKAEIVVGPFL